MDTRNVPDGYRAIAAEDGATILNAIFAFPGRFVAHPSEAAHVAHALWIAHTHLMEAWESTPRIAFLSPEPGSGKTRALEISELLVPRPVEAVNVTPAYLFRKVADAAGRPTILFDEIDTVFGPKAKDNEEIRGLLNACHRRGAVAGRCVMRGRIVETEEIPAYCAVALAGSGTYLTPSSRVPSSSGCVAAHPKSASRLTGAACMLLKARAYETGSLTGQVRSKALSPMHGQICRTESGIATRTFGSRFSPSQTKPAAPGRSGLVLRLLRLLLSKESTPSLGVPLLADLRDVFGSREVLATESILVALHMLDESPWMDIKGKPLNDRTLAVKLRRYDIEPKVLRIGTATARGYHRSDFLDVWTRYLPTAA